MSTNETPVQVLATAEDYLIIINEQVRSMLNPRLARQQGVDTKAGMEKIRQLHVQRILMEDEFHQNQNSKTFEEIQKFLEDWKQNQFELQDAWNFPRSENFHRFFDIPSCSCHNNPFDFSIRSHNMKAYPNGNYRYSEECILHKHLV